MIDGATPWQAFVTIILPLVRPILAVVTILSFVGMYNEFVLAAVIIGVLTFKNFQMGQEILKAVQGIGVGVIE